MNKDMPWQDLARYFAGEMDKQETKEMKSWIQTDPKREQVVHHLYNIWEESGELPQQLDIDHAWDKLSEGMDRLEGEAKADDHSPVLNLQTKSRTYYQHKRSFGGSGRKMYRTAISAAAAAIIIISGLLSYYYIQNNEPINIPDKQFITQTGERAIFTLKDGSKVVLYPESRLKVPVHFSGNSRDVYLRGEAYFEVDHEAGRPFIVHTKNAVTREIGTKFLVKAWPDKPNVQVVVAEGKVALRSSRETKNIRDNEVMLTQNQIGVLGKDDKVTVSAVQNISQYLGWTKGQIVFNNQPLGKVIPELERWYPVTIHLKGSDAAAQKLSAKINYKVQSIGDVMQGIALSLGLKVDRTGRVITLISKE